MRTALTTFFYLCVSMAAVEPVVAESWRGIVPLRSTRQDVVRLLGQCSSQADRCDFGLLDGDVYIVFSGSERCADHIPAGTVLLIERELNSTSGFDELNLDKKRFKTFDPSWPR